MKFRFLFIPILLIGFGCHHDDDDPRPECGPDILIVDAITTVVDDDFTLISAVVEDLCLTVTIVNTACSSEGWQLDLLTFGEVAESHPTQTAAFFRFDDGIDDDGGVICQAEIMATYSFDLTPYLESALPTFLSLEGLEEPILIE